MGLTAPWPVMPIHAAITPDGRLLTYGRDDYAQPEMLYDVWDWTEGLSNNSHLTLPNSIGTDLFCSNTMLLNNGKMLLVGGDIRTDIGANNIGWQTNRGTADANIFDSTTNELTRNGEMNEPRWYATVTKLPWGEIFIHGGAVDVDADIGATFTEIANEDASNFRVLSSFKVDDLPWYYPRNFVNRYGDIIGWSHSYAYRIDPRGTGSREDFGNAPQVELNNGSLGVMYRPGKVLLGGGGKKVAIAADINGVFPAYEEVPAMDSQRLWGTATVLPDGRVLVSNGGTSDTSIEGAPLGDPAYHVSIYDPDAKTWTRGPSSAHARLYHSTSILLPDATVLIGGGGFPGPVTNLNAEIYYPPYLFNDDGTLAQRPVLIDVPDVVSPKQTFNVKTDNNQAIGQIALIKTGAVTHSFDVDQRFIPLPFTRDGDSLRITLPQYEADTPPGFYHLFVLNEQGVPSLSKIMRMRNASGPLPARPAVGPRTVTVGGTEGTYRELSCAADERLVGIHGHGYDRLYRLGPTCVSIDSATGRWQAEPIQRAMAGDMYRAPVNPDYGRFEVNCPANHAVSGYSGASDADGRFIGRLELSCQPLGANGQVAGTPVSAQPVGGFEANVTASCPASQSATGMFGSADVNGIYRFGLRCGA